MQWATGGLLFLWVTSRRREVGLGYGWLLRSVYGLMAVGAVAASRYDDVRPFSLGVCLAAGAALLVSILRRRAGVRDFNRRRERVSSMIGGVGVAEGPEFPPALDLVGPAIGAVGLVLAAHAAGGPFALAAVRTLVGACFLGAVSDAMLLGHWYLVQPGLGRAALLELVRWVAITWPVEVAAMLWPTGMVSVFTGAIDDGWGGTLGWFWAACAITTIALCFVTRKALDERAYSAVMAATGLLYLAILTAFGTDLVARAVLAG